MRKNIFGLFIGLLITGVAPARPENASVAPNHTTPDALVKQALQRNPELNFFVAEIAAAKGAVQTAGTVRNPELSTEIGYKNSRENSGGVSGDGAILALSLSQTFEYPSRIALRKAIANHDLALAGLHVQQFRLITAARVRSLAYASTSAHEKTKAVQEVASRTQALDDVLKQRPLAGVAPQLEAQIISANLLTFQRQERESTLAEKTIAAELNQLCGRSADAPLTVNASSIVFGAVSVPELVDAARSNAFDIRIRQVELAQQGFKVALSKNERLPAVAVGPFYSLENAIDREQRVGVGVSLPLPLWDRNLGNIASSKARQQQAEASLAMAAREVERRVTQTAAHCRQSEPRLRRGRPARWRNCAKPQSWLIAAIVLVQSHWQRTLRCKNNISKPSVRLTTHRRMRSKLHKTLEILTGQKLYREEEER